MTLILIGAAITAAGPLTSTGSLRSDTTLVKWPSQATRSEGLNKNATLV